MVHTYVYSWVQIIIITKVIVSCILGMPITIHSVGNAENPDFSTLQNPGSPHSSTPLSKILHNTLLKTSFLHNIFPESYIIPKMITLRTCIFYLCSPTHMYICEFLAFYISGKSSAGSFSPDTSKGSDSKTIPNSPSPSINTVSQPKTSSDASGGSSLFVTPSVPKKQADPLYSRLGPRRSFRIQKTNETKV